MATEQLTFFDDKGVITGSLEIEDDQATVDLNKELHQNRWITGIFSPDTHYVMNGDAVARPEQETRFEDGVLKGLPVPCTININGDDYPCNDDVAELDFSQPTTYTITVKAWPYLDKVFVHEDQG